MVLHSAFALICFYFSLAHSPVAAKNFLVPWSTLKFGPDGPWQAVTITVGGNDSTIKLGTQHTADLVVYPGGYWGSLAFTKEACAAIPDSPCSLGGTWDPDFSEYKEQVVGYEPPPFNDAAYGRYVEFKPIILGLTIDQKTVWNATLSSATSGNITYPNGKVAVPLGTLSLGAENVNQFFEFSTPVPNQGYNASLFNGKLFEDGEISSYSYGLHIGSAAFDYPGSLAFGGYDKGRVIEPVTSFADIDKIDLIDIVVGVEAGASPFEFTSKTKLLSGGQKSVQVDPLAPYLSLPRETCDNLAKLLPVTFDQSLKYYLWNTDDPRFKEIVSSPAYLGFTFPPTPGGAENVVIKVPFALLNLTLDRPITDSPKQYFPCVPFEGTPPVLGRAFLQAALLGRNWKRGTSWLAQAPGPGIAHDGLGEQYTDIQDGDTMIKGFDSDRFNSSWDPYWTVIAGKGTASPTDDTNEPAPASGLSTGAKAGIGAGVGAGALALLLVLGLLWRKRSSKRTPLESSAPALMTGPSGLSGDNKYIYANQAESAYDTHASHAPIAELPGHHNVNGSPVEIEDSSNPHRRS